MRATLVRALIAASLAAGAFMASSSAAQAFDAYPCGAPWWHNASGGLVQTCPDWAPNNRIPVYRNLRGDSPIEGYIHAPGSDWYMCQIEGAGYILNTGRATYTNYWWAFTWADNNRSGFVNQVYFQGGGNNERDGNLKICP